MTWIVVIFIVNFIVGFRMAEANRRFYVDHVRNERSFYATCVVFVLIVTFGFSMMIVSDVFRRLSLTFDMFRDFCKEEALK